MKTINKIIFITVIAGLLFVCTGCNIQLDSGNEDIVIYVDKQPGDGNYGYKIINPDENYSESFMTKRMIYYINDEIDFNNKTINIAEDCVLLFGENGKIKNGTITFNKTFLDGFVNFSNMRFSGNLINKTCKTSWFGLNKTDSEESTAEVKNAEKFSEIFSCIGPDLIIDGFYPVSSLIKISTKITMIAPDWSMSCLTSDYNFTYVPKYGFYTTGKKVSLFSLTNTSSVNAYGIYFKGFPEEFTGKTNPSDITYAFILPNCGSLASVYNCKIEGFMQGIRGVGGFIEKIQNTSFNACQVGLFFAWTSDFDVFGCRFTNCMPDVDIKDKAPGEKFIQDDFNDIRHLGAGVWACKGGMINFADNYYENNIIDFVANECDIIINITDSYFKNPSFCNFYFYNDYGRQQSPWLGLVPSELHKYAIDNFIITGNSFNFTKNPKGKCLALVRETNMVYLGDSSGSSEQHRERGMNVIFAGNEITDSRSIVLDGDAIFAVSVADDTKGTITCSSNNFSGSKAECFVNVLPTQFKKYLGRTDPSNPYKDVYDYIDVTSGKFTFVTNENTWGFSVTENEIIGDSNFIAFK